MQSSHIHLQDARKLLLNLQELLHPFREKFEVFWLATAIFFVSISISAKAVTTHYCDTIGSMCIIQVTLKNVSDLPHELRT